MEKVIDALKKYNKFLIISHIGLEGDSIGSQFALQGLLENMGKSAVIVNEDRPAAQYDFLGVRYKVINDLDIDFDYEAAVVLDCPVVKRIGKAKKFIKEGKVVINIDHHISNGEFGDVNWVEPAASSCGEMIYRLYKAMDAPLDKRCAEFLYIAIITDTGSFAYENTTSDTHITASELLKKGLKPDIIYQSLYENRSMAEVELLKDALVTLRVIRNGDIAHMHVTRKMLDRYNLGAEVTEGFINYARSIDKAKVAIIFIEDPREKGYVHISFRSKGKVDVNKIAALFEGGGHRKASGCVIRGDLKSVMKKVLDTVKEKL